MKKIIYLLISIFIAIIVMTIPVSADTGPKPETHIEITNLDESDYILGVLSKHEDYYGPHPSLKTLKEISEKEDSKYYTELYDSLKPLEEIDVPDGWYVLALGETYTNTTTIEYSCYYWFPDDFRLVLLNTKTNSTLIFNEAQTYAFASYFKYDCSMNSDLSLNYDLTLEKDYHYGKEILEFFVRLAATLVIELGLALLFKFRGKSFIILAITNITTQIALNVSLNLVAHFNGRRISTIIVYVFVELAIAALEATVFRLFLTRGKDNTKKWIVLYSILSNVLSFSLGIILWYIW